MNSLKKMAIGFGLVSVITLQGLQASKLKECQSKADKISGCAELEYYANSDIKKETPYKNGKEHGSIKGYYENGKLEFEIPTKNGEPNGIAKLYYENGNIKTEGNFIEYKKHGDYKFYSKYGKLLGTSRYNHGEAQFVKCAEKSLSKDDAKYLLGDITIESFETYCNTTENNKEGGWSPNTSN